MNFLIIGVTSLFGPFLLERLCGENNHIVVTKVRYEKFTVPNGYESNIEVVNLDLLDKNCVDVLIKNTRPDVIYNFAVQNSVTGAWGCPDDTIDLNVSGTLNLLDVVRELDYTPRVIVAGSGEEYGELPFSSMPIKEDVRQNPRNIFAASKVCQSMICELYARAYGMDIIVLCTFNEIGPGQSDRFVVSNLCHQFARIEAGKQSAIIEVGNVNIKRDFTDARDLVRAFAIAANRRLVRNKYNIGRGQAVTIADVIGILERSTGIDVEIKSMNSRMRSIDSPILEADSEAFYKETNWKTQIPIENTVEDILNYWRIKEIS